MIVLKNILVATDFGEAAAVALRYGRELARNFGSTLHVLHVVDDLAARAVGFPEYAPNLVGLQAEAVAAARKQLEALLSDEDRSMLRAKSIVLVSQWPARTILEYARDVRVDALLLGTHGRGKLAQLFMGSVAEKVVRHAPCPVLTVRHPEHEFVLPDALQTVTRA
ncbi:MAG TPA: universal stress protein [Vicinamibacterales bacterium]|nr:universal stress protein [Vicinamibacterales bacterium]